MTTKQDNKPQQGLTPQAGQTSQAVGRPQGAGPVALQRLRMVISAEAVQQQFRNALADSAGPFLASVLELVSSDTALQQCDPNAVILEALKAASLKLPINRQLGFAFIVPFNGRPTFLLGYKGMIQLALRSGQYRALNAGIIYEGMVVKPDYLIGRITIEGAPTSEKAIGYFAYLQLVNGFEKATHMTVAGALAHGKRYSKSYNNPKGLWATNPDAMGVKTCIRDLLSHWGIMSTDMQRAMQVDDEADEASVASEIAENANRTRIDISAATEAPALETGGKPVEEEAPF